MMPLLRVPRTDEHERSRTLLKEVGEILRSGHRSGFDDSRRAEYTAGRSPNATDRLGRVDDRRIPGRQLELQPASGGARRMLQRLTRSIAQQGSNAVVERSQCSLETRLVRNDVAGSAGMQRTDGHDRRLDRIHRARDDRLQRRHCLCRGHDRIESPVRHGAVAATAANHGHELVLCCHRGSGPNVQRAGLERRPEVQPVNRTGLDDVEDTRLDHAQATAAALLSRLETEHDVANQLVAARREQRRRAEQHRGVAVVPARVHAPVVLRSVFPSGNLLDRKRIHVGAQQNRGPPAAGGPQHADDAGHGDAGRDLELQPAKRLGDEGGRSGLLEGQLRPPMEVASPTDEPLRQRLGFRP